MALASEKDKAKRYYPYTSHEIRGLAIAIILTAFVVSFNEWGKQGFNFAEGLYNLFNAVLIVALSFLVHDAGQRILGLAIGYKIEFRMWTFGILISLIAAFVSNGNIWLIVPGGFMIHHLAGHRLGFFRYGVNYFGQAMVALSGPLFTLILIILLKMLNVIMPNPVLHKAIMFNVIFLITSMLPIPPLDGSKIYFGSRMLYAFVLPVMIASAVMFIIDIPLLFALVLSLTVGIVLWLTYYITFERKIWTGPK